MGNWYNTPRRRRPVPNRRLLRTLSQQTSPLPHCPQQLTFHRRDSCVGDMQLRQKRIDNVQRKHVRIHGEEKIWHYSNTCDVVVSQKPELFARHDGSKGYSVFYGTFPV